VTLVAEIRKLYGLLAALTFGVVWAYLAAGTPTSTYHFAPLIVAGAWVAVDGARGAGLTQRRVVNEATGGAALAIAVTLILEVKGDLSGPTFWEHGADAPVVLEHVLFAVLGAVLGASYALRVAARAPRGL